MLLECHNRSPHKWLRIRALRRGCPKGAPGARNYFHGLCYVYLMPRHAPCLLSISVRPSKKEISVTFARIRDDSGLGLSFCFLAIQKKECNVWKQGVLWKRDAGEARREV
jgi:hypothetical protein